MANFEISNATTRASSRLLRIEQAAAILDRSPRTVRYHARKLCWRKFSGLVEEDDVNRLRIYLEDYYVTPYDASTRRRQGGR